METIANYPAGELPPQVALRLLVDRRVNSGYKFSVIDQMAKIAYGAQVNKWHGAWDCEPRNFGHEIISHAFQNFLALTQIEEYVKLDEEHLKDGGVLKGIYDRFAEAAEIPKQLRQIGWEEYKHD